MKLIALFDFDQTLIRQNSLKSLFSFWKTKSFAYYLLKNWDCLSFKSYVSFKTSVKEVLYMEFFNGKNKQQLIRASKELSSRVSVNLKSLSILNKCREEKMEIGIITASPEVFVGSLLESLSISFSFIIGTKLEEDSKGFYTGKMDGPECIRHEKINAINKHLSKSTDLFCIKVAAGNLPEDGPMLELAEAQYSVYKRNGQIKRI